MPGKNPQKSKSSSRSPMSITYWRKSASHRLVYLILAIVFAFGIVAYFGSGPGGQGGMNRSNERGQETIASVNGQAITLTEYQGQWDRMRRQGSLGGPAEEASMQGRIVSVLVDMAIMKAEAGRLGLSVPDSKLDSALNEMRTMAAGPNSKTKLSDEDLVRMTGAESIDELRESKRSDLLVTALGEHLSGAGKLTEEDLARTYDSVKLRGVLVGYAGSQGPSMSSLPEDQAKRKAEQVAAEARSGKDFAALANAQTEDPQNKPTKFDQKTKKQVPDGVAKGGDLGWVTRSGKLEKVLEDAVFAAKAGDVVGPLKGKDGYHVYKLEGAKRELPKDYDKEKAKLMSELRQRKSYAAIQPFLEDQRNKARITWQDPTMEWRYLYSKSETSDTMMQPAAANKAQADLITKLRAVSKARPDDSAAPLLLGTLLYRRYMTGDIGATPEKQMDQATRYTLRDEAMAFMELALKRTEDDQTRFTLAELYQATNRPDKALEHYTMVQRRYSSDDSPSSRETHVRLRSAFATLGKSDLVMEEDRRIALVKARAGREAAEQKERDARIARERAEREKKEKEAKSKAAPAPGAPASTPGATPPASTGAPAAPASPPAAAPSAAPAAGAAKPPR